MGIIPWSDRWSSQRRSSNQEPYQLLRREVDSLFDRFFSWPEAGQIWGEEGNWSPSLDVAENDSNVTVKAEIPGVDPRNIELSVDNNRLLIRGEKKDEREEKGQSFHRVERSFGSFLRSVDLPPNTNPDAITAEHKNGVLTVTIQKSKGAEAKKIPVKTA